MRICSPTVPILVSSVSTQIATRFSSMKVISQDTQKGIVANTISVWTVRTKTLIKGTTTPTDLVTVELPNINARHVVRSLCLILKRGDTSRMASAQSNTLIHLHTDISCGNNFQVDLSKHDTSCYQFYRLFEYFRFVVNVETKTHWKSK